MNRFWKLAILVFLSVVALLLPLAGEAKTLIRLVHSLPSHAPVGLGAQRFERDLERGAKGELEVKIYTLSDYEGKRMDDIALIKAIQNNEIEMGVMTTASLVNADRRFGVFDLPFLFRDYPHVDKVLDGEIGADLLKLLTHRNLLGLGYWDNGFRNFTSRDRPLLKPEDFKGLKVRVMESPVYMEMVKTLGATPVPTASVKIYDTLKNKYADAQENPYNILADRRLFEVQKFVMETRHSYSPRVLFISQKFFAGLPAHLQEKVLAAAQEATMYQRKQFRTLELVNKEKCVKAGMEIVPLTDTERQAFGRAMENVYKLEGKLIGDALIERIRNVR